MVSVCGKGLRVSGETVVSWLQIGGFLNEELGGLHRGTTHY